MLLLFRFLVRSCFPVFWLRPVASRGLTGASSELSSYALTDSTVNLLGIHSRTGEINQLVYAKCVVQCDVFGELFRLPYQWHAQLVLICLSEVERNLMATQRQRYHHNNHSFNEKHCCQPLCLPWACFDLYTTDTRELVHSNSELDPLFLRDWQSVTTWSSGPSNLKRPLAAAAGPAITLKKRQQTTAQDRVRTWVGRRRSLTGWRKILTS